MPSAQWGFGVNTCVHAVRVGRGPFDPWSWARLLPKCSARCRGGGLSARPWVAVCSRAGAPHLQPGSSFWSASSHTCLALCGRAAPVRRSAREQRARSCPQCCARAPHSGVRGSTGRLSAPPTWGCGSGPSELRGCGRRVKGLGGTKPLPLVRCVRLSFTGWLFLSTGHASHAAHAERHVAPAVVPSSLAVGRTPSAPRG